MWECDKLSAGATSQTLGMRLRDTSRYYCDDNLCCDGAESYHLYISEVASVPAIHRVVETSLRAVGVVHGPAHTKLVYSVVLSYITATL